MTFPIAPSRRPLLAALFGSLLALVPAVALAQDHGGGHDHDGHPAYGGGPHPGDAPYRDGDGRDRGYGGRAYLPVIDRGRPGWWRARPGFAGYYGFRPGYYYAPTYGYYAIPAGYAGRAWVVGATLPPPMRRYIVLDPAVYGLAPPPPGFGWYYAGTNLVLVTRATSVIVQSVAGGW